LELTTQNADETQAFGRRLGALLAVGDLVLLRGTLGAGKTTLTQGIAWGAGVSEYAHSPTFVLVNEYHGRLPIYHLDLYRFAGGEGVDVLGEVEDLAIDEMLEAGACVVEWAERAAAVFEGDHLEIALAEGSTDDERSLVLTPHGDRPVRLLAQLAGESDRGERP
jgi:tRNA threonylcarbamoyladenosine biosynthesis protein TsaE